VTGSLARRLKEKARALGFDRAGITHAGPPADYDRYRRWLEAGFAADLWYLSETGRVEKRGDLARLLPGIRSVVAVAASYAPPVSVAATDARFARYGWGEDYHSVLRDRLESLARWLHGEAGEPGAYRVYVDTGPILERSLAERAGVGWIGKNTCLIAQETGSYLLLGEILTTLELPPDPPALNRCGSCTRCLDACPTNALAEPYRLDARKCISYHTIENRNAGIPPDVADALDGWVAGCDICQEVCPWNLEPLAARLPEFSPLPHVRLTLVELADLDPMRFDRFFGRTSFRRIGRRNMIRNAGLARSARRFTKGGGAGNMPPP
jgi:epoxyqueuosine reductase